MRYVFVMLAMMSCQLLYAQKGGKLITLEDLYKNGTFIMKSVPGFNGMKDGLHFTKVDTKDQVQSINVYSLETGKIVKPVLSNKSLAPNGKKLDIGNYTFSEDETKLLIFTEPKQIYRHSAFYRVHVYDTKTQKLELIDTGKIMHASFSPDGSKVAFMQNNNLYYKDLKTGKRIAVTTDGKWNHIINGNCDWVYEEEFSFTKAYQWSPDGKYIAYYRFDESKVPEFSMHIYNGLYPENYTYKYPKAGEVNSVVEIRVHNLTNNTTVTVNTGKETDQYIPRIKWTKKNNELCVYVLNRLQNELQLLLADGETGFSQVIYTEKNKYYIDINDNIEFLPDGHSFIFTTERNKYTHLYHWDWKSRVLKELTPGKFDIDEIVGIDAKRKKVYYTAAEKSPMERKLYSVNWNGSGKTLLTTEDGTHAITSIEGYNFFLDKYSRLNEPPIYYLRNNSGKIVRTLEDNIAFTLKLQDYALGKVTLTTFKGAYGDDLNAWVMTPPDFDKNKKYPVLMFQYSGPASQQVRDMYPLGNYFWHQMLAQKGYIVVCADGTGTGMRGEEFRKKTYLQLGKMESDDQIAVAKELGKLPYVDKDRIGIWGWSYGGFMSSISLFKGADVFKMAIAVAPVTNWRYYNNIYTERYMRRPQENPDGYDNNAPEKMAKNLQGKFLLIHGTADDNVHFQNAAVLTEQLIQANKEFESEYYPDKAHGISGGNSRYHLYNRMTNFILNNL